VKSECTQTLFLIKNLQDTMIID